MDSYLYRCTPVLSELGSIAKLHHIKSVYKIGFVVWDFKVILLWNFKVSIMDTTRLIPQRLCEVVSSVRITRFTATCDICTKLTTLKKPFFAFLSHLAVGVPANQCDIQYLMRRNKALY